MKRVAIIGPAGSGKSFLARQLGPLLDLEVIHLDALYWRPGWVETPKAEWRRTVEGLAARGSWIIDGDYGGTMDACLEAADTIVFLDFPRITCVWRVVNRRFQYAREARPDIAPGCPERFGWEFVKFVRWVWDYPKRSRPSVLERIERYSAGRQVHILWTPTDVEGFLRNVKKQQSSIGSTSSAGD